jgi:hypothetical protein
MHRESHKAIDDFCPRKEVAISEITERIDVTRVKIVP